MDYQNKNRERFIHHEDYEGNQWYEEKIKRLL